MLADKKIVCAVHTPCPQCDGMMHFVDPNIRFCAACNEAIAVMAFSTN